jgi:hypothetical protein
LSGAKLRGRTLLNLLDARVVILAEKRFEKRKAENQERKYEPEENESFSNSGPCFFVFWFSLSEIARA